ncbi:Major Facilitator Superfamily transporter [Caulobacter sp. AP07]|uniref:MFS transporter n=1 Tax=Caulobacter sp. AP07 TaxID=1144304 RepID=UPI00027201D5|nr:Major Facilitator Superfamily transporter [Caulobacter sp. AP07]
MCCGLFGIQIVWGLQNVNTSRIFQTLGADVNELAILWIAAPATGLLVQPIIGHLSDKTWGRLGRRRPYIFSGSILTAIALFLMPNVSTVWAASVMLWVLSASINVAMEPFRAFVADTLPEEQRTTGFAMQVFFIGAGAVFASALPWALTHWFGVSGQAAPGVLPKSVHAAFYVGGVSLLAAVMWTVFTTREHPPEALGDDRPGERLHRAPTPAGAAVLLKSGVLWVLGGLVVGVLAALGHWAREVYVLAAVAAGFGAAQLAAIWLRRRGHVSLGVLEVVEDILHMPRVLRQLAITQFFTWFGLFAMWIYTTPAVTARHYGAADAASAAYNRGADWVGVLFAGYNGVAALVALMLPALAARIGRRASHALCLGLGALGFLGFVLIDDPALLWIPIVGIGVAWSSVLSAPYAMLSSAAPSHKMGVYMGIHNLFLVIPQLVAATVLGPLVKYVFKGEAIFALGLAAAAFALAALSAFAIDDAGDRRPADRA